MRRRQDAPLTIDERLRQAQATVDLTWPLSLPNLPPPAAAMAIPFDAVEVGIDQARLLLDAWRCHDDDRIAERDRLLVATKLLGRLHGPIAATNGNAFVRLGGTSARDSFDADGFGRPKPVRTNQGALLQLLSSIELVGEHLQAAVDAETPTHVLVRPFLDVAPDAEYRIFVIDGHVAGMSQRNVGTPHPAPYVAFYEHLPALNDFATRFLPTMRIASYCVDVFVDDDGAATMIDVNPDVRTGRTDPLLFRSGPWDGRLRIVREADAADRATPDAEACLA